MTESAITIVSLLPDLLGTYGDNGNVLVLERRLAWRGIAYEVQVVNHGEPVPVSGDLYVLGGGEDQAQTLAVSMLRDGVLNRAVDAGAWVLGVCAGMQVLGTSFALPDGRMEAGLGLLDLSTDRLTRRAVGEVVAQPSPELGLPLLTGFENHGGRTVLGPGARPLGRVLQGEGNGGGQGLEGAVQGRVVGTYLHGPVLARNPALADMLLSQVVDQPLSPLDDSAADLVRLDRLGRWSRSRKRAA